MPDSYINLVEYSKNVDDPTESALVEQFATSSDVLMAMGFQTARQGRHIFRREGSLAALAFRAINAEPEISYGTDQEFQDQCFPISGLLRNDRIMRKRYGEDHRVKDMKGQMKRGAAIWTDTFINGDNTSEPKEFSGFKARLKADSTGAIDGSTDDSRLLTNNNASGGGPLSLSKLDMAIELTNQPNAILMPRRLHTRMEAAARDPALTNNQITQDMDSELGRRVTRYKGIPILHGYDVGKSQGLYPFLPFNEVGSGGGSAVTASVYVMSFREDGVSGIQTSPPEVLDLGHADKGIFLHDLFEWDCGVTQEDHYAALRLSSITNAAVVA